MNAAPTRIREAAAVPDAAPRVSALERALAILDDRIEPVRLQHARQVAKHASERLELSSSHTVVALAGATGSGKSSLFNALVGLDLSAVGVRRPTTGLPHACVWGPEGASELLDWLGIPPRLQTARESVLDAETQVELRGLALLDLPDHDSIEIAHRREVDRLVQMVDMLVWVLDPQKYADAALHVRYLRDLSRHASVLVVVLNQIDKLTAEEAELCLTDLRRLLDEDGLIGVRVLATSAIRGDGLSDLREILTEAVAAHNASALRMSADLDGVSEELNELAGPEVREDIDRTAVKRLCATLALAAGVPAVGEAVERTYKHRARYATVAPVVSGVGWLARAIRRLGARGGHPTADIDVVYENGANVSGAGGVELSDAVSEPATDGAPHAGVRQHAVLHAQVETALRDLADTASHGLPDPWPLHTRRAALAALADLPEALDNAVAGADLGLDRAPAWWRVSTVLQAAALALAVAGGGWLAFVAMSDLAEPRLGEISVPLILVAVGLATTISVWAISWALAAELAVRTRAHAEESLNDAVTAVARERVLAPVRGQLRKYAQLRDALLTLDEH
jgi:GTP-binding protein EngB required for normal cell division